MIPSFKRCVQAIATASVDDGRGSDPAVANAVAAFILATWQRMPDHIRIGIGFATLLFDAASIPRFGKPFHRIGAERQRTQLSRWEKAPFGAMRSLAAFYRSLAIFAAESLGADGETSDGQASDRTKLVASA